MRRSWDTMVVLPWAAKSGLLAPYGRQVAALACAPAAVAFVLAVAMGPRW